MDKQKKSISILWGIFALLVLLLIIVWFFFLRNYKYTDDAYVQGNQVYITPLQDGFVTSVLTDDSFLVKQGQLLVTLDETDATISLEKSKDNLAQTVRNVCELFHQVFAYKAEIKVKTAQLIVRAQDLFHREKVFREQGVSVEDYQHAIAALRSEYYSLKMTASLYRKTLAQIQNTSIDNHPLVLAAQNQVLENWVRLYRCKIYSPVKGLVAQRIVQVGMWIPGGKALMSVIPLDQIWVNANFKETQIKHFRLGQNVDITADLWGEGHVFHGKVVGLPGGAGNAFALLPPENLSGNWIKIVQRLPVRVELDPTDLEHHPLRLGLSCRAIVDISNQDGEMIPVSNNQSPKYETPIFKNEEKGSEEFIKKIIKENIDPNLEVYTNTPFNLPEIIISLPPIVDEALRQNKIIESEVYNYSSNEEMLDSSAENCLP